MTPKEEQGLLRLLRKAKAYRSLDVSELERIIFGYLLVDQRPISVTALHELSGYSRRSVRSSLLDLQVMGLGERLPSGWVLTDLGRVVFTSILREGEQIGEGLLFDFSSELKDVLRALPTEGVVRPFKGLD